MGRRYLNILPEAGFVSIRSNRVRPAAMRCRATGFTDGMRAAATA